MGSPFLYTNGQIMAMIEYTIVFVEVCFVLVLASVRKTRLVRKAIKLTFAFSILWG